jgi:hypothetical protein
MTVPICCRSAEIWPVGLPARSGDRPEQGAGGLGALVGDQAGADGVAHQAGHVVDVEAVH